MIARSHLSEKREYIVEKAVEIKDRLHHAAAGLVHNYHDAEDVVQDAFITMWERATFDERYGAFITWAYDITRSRATDHYRKKHGTKRRTSAPKELLYSNLKGSEIKSWYDQRDVSEASPLESLGTQETSVAVREALEKIKEHHRKMIILRYFEGWNNREIGKVFDLDEVTIAGHLRRAREKLRDYLEELLLAA